MLGGQGGDEIFGGYVRYLIAYFEQCIKGAIEGTTHSGNFVVTYESIIPNLADPARVQAPAAGVLARGPLRRPRRALLPADQPRAGPRRRDRLGSSSAAYSPFETFKQIFHGDNVKKESYFDSMTHFDFKTLLPALLQVEDRVSMAHGLESRVPLLDHPLVELAATMPADVKFKDGHLKHVLKTAFAPVLPEAVRERRDKMGFPVPLQEWIGRGGPVRDFVVDTLSSDARASRALVDNAQGRREARPRAALRPQGLGAAFPGALAAGVPRPRCHRSASGRRH